VAKKTNNFRKFGKLASLVKKIADKNPELKQQILDESESNSKNSWNKIQKWTSKNLFPTFKELPLKDFTLKNVENAINDDVATKKKSKCHNVFAIPDSDLGIIDPFDLEETIRSFPPNTQVQVGLSNGDNLVNTGIVKVKDMPNVGNGELTAGIRVLYDFGLGNITFFRIRKKGKKQGDKSNCSYFIKAVFVGDESANETIDEFLTDDEKERRVVKGVNLKDLTDNQKKNRKQLKDLIKKENSAKKSKSKKREFLTPDKVVGKKEDKIIQAKIKKAKDPRALADALQTLREDFKDGVFTKKEYKEERAKLLDKFEKGGII
jgi:hypothetical protein|tara:strand:+ start:777 stop:1736 length:960 start_codon:yes stop_codon:yes gene_type:complete